MDLRENGLEIEGLKDELKVARELLQKTKQPNSYLIDELEKKEKELVALRHKLNTLNNEKDYLTQNMADQQQVSFPKLHSN
jgi:predicted nuclease with TOPRIM domain